VPSARSADAPDVDWIVLDALWTAVVNDFANDARHDKFLDEARRQSALPEAARRYRALLQNATDDPERAAIKRRLDAIAIVATHELVASQTSDRWPDLRRRVMIVLVVLVAAALIGWGGWLLWLWQSVRSGFPLR
jgi:hypothetical protein